MKEAAKKAWKLISNETTSVEQASKVKAKPIKAEVEEWGESAVAVSSNKKATAKHAEAKGRIPSGKAQDLKTAAAAIKEKPEGGLENAVAASKAKAKEVAPREETAAAAASKEGAKLNRYAQQWDEIACKLLNHGIPSASVARMLQRCRNLGHVGAGVESVLQDFKSLDMTERDMGRVISQWPTILGTSNSMFIRKVEFFESIGIDRIALGRILSVTAAAVTCSLYFLNHHASFWKDYLKDMPNVSVGALITKNPRLLTYSLENTVKPKVAYLEKVGFDKVMLFKHSTILGRSVESIKSKVNMLEGFGMSNPRKLAWGLSVLHGISNSTIEARFNNLLRLGFSRAQVGRILLPCPKLLSIREERVNQKVDYAVSVMKLQLDELASCSSFWSHSFENRIKHRNEVMMELKTMGTLQKKLSLSYLIKMTDSEFRRKFEEKLLACPF